MPVFPASSTLAVRLADSVVIFSVKDPVNFDPTTTVVNAVVTSSPPASITEVDRIDSATLDGQQFVDIALHPTRWREMLVLDRSGAVSLWAMREEMRSRRLRADREW